MSQEVKIICIVEDNKSINKLYSTLLKKAGYLPEAFFDGKTAYEWLKNNNAACLVLDMLLPDMNGPDLLNLIRELPNCKNVPAIAVTGFALGKDKEQFLNLGFDFYMPKPINTASFVSQVKEVIANKK